jgi:putative transposase
LSSTLRQLVRHLHSDTARTINAEDSAPGRRIWFEYHDTHLTFEKSYLARLNYVMNNPVKHGLVPVATQYPWCSAGWFEQHAVPSFYKRITQLNTDQVQVPDDFQLLWER